jgi:serine protease Do
MANWGIGEVAERLRRATVQVRSGPGGRGSGSGILWNHDGLIVTNSHVVHPPSTEVELWDGRRFPAELTARDQLRDLALLKIRAGALEPADPGDSDALRVGELVMAIGNPLGFVGALSTGVVHALGPVRGLGQRSWVQADIRLLPGNSGGPLADARGRVVGINTMIAGGLALSVPSNAVPRVLKGGGSNGMLGVVIQPVRVPVEGRPALGLLVLRVEPGSPAAAASLLIGDVLIGTGGRPFTSPDDLAQAIEDAAGGVLPLEFLRGDRRLRRTVAVRLARWRAEAA